MQLHFHLDTSVAVPSVDVELIAETFERPFLQHLCFWPSSQNIPLLRVLMYAAHSRLWQRVCYINPRFTLHYITFHASVHVVVACK